MPGRNLSTVYRVLVAWFVLLVGADCALAYVGPGAGITFSSSAKFLLVLLLLACLAVLLWPLYALLRWIRRDKNQSSTPPEAAPEEAPSVSHTDS
jgi:hypothetical protein